MSRWPTPTKDQLRDGSGLSGTAEGILNPTTEAEASRMIRENRDVKITFQGTRTGLCGGSVPEGGIMLGTAYLKWMKEPVQDGDDILVRTGAGLTLDQLDMGLEKNWPDYIWPPRPTEETATVGGVCVLGASGPNACHYGATRQYIAGVHLIDGEGTLREVTDPAELDRIVGSEGALGLVTEVTIRLVRRPETTWAVALFFDEERQAVRCGRQMETLPCWGNEVYLTANEFMDRGSLDLIDRFRSTADLLQGVPEFPEGTRAMLYVEIAGAASGMMPSLMPVVQCAAACGSDPDRSWAQTSPQGVTQLRHIRHIAAEAVNAVVKEAREAQEDPGIVKLGLDLAWPDGDPEGILARYRADLEASGLASAIYGHLYNCNLHVNILPADREEYDQGEALMRKWTMEGLEEGALACCEHGKGRLKKRILPQE